MIFDVFRLFIKGGYINFGVFVLYNDNSFQQILHYIINTIANINANELSAYKKFALVTLGLTEELCSNNCGFLLLYLQDEMINTLLSVTSVGLDSTDNDIVSLSTNAISNFYGFMFNSMKNPPNPIYGNALKSRITEFINKGKENSQTLLRRILRVICFEEGV